MYHYADVDGFVARGPGVRTWRAMRLALDGPVSREFVAHGHTDAPQRLAAELAGVAADTPLDGLRRAALAAQEVLVLTDGTGVEQQWLERRRRR
jgi:hypothetical protein